MRTCCTNQSSGEQNKRDTSRGGGERVGHSPKLDVFVPVPRVRAGLFPNRPVPVPKEEALVVVVPKPAVLLPNRF